MNRRSLFSIITVLGILGIGQVMAFDVLASQPNIVLSQAIHFTNPAGKSVTVSPGKYFVETVGPTHLRLRAEEGSTVIDIQARSFTHEQYELFSAMAMTRPGKGDLFYIDLLLPGGIRLEATGSTSPPSESTLTVPSLPHSSQGTSSPSRTSVPPAHQPRSIALPPPLESVWAYVPPKAKIPGEREDGVQRSQQGEWPDLFVLAPDHLGLTIFEQPTLYWYLTQSSNQPIDMIMRERESLRVVFDVRLLPPLTAGLHPMNLMDYNMRLIKNISYQWVATIRIPTLTGTVTASGFIMRVDPPQFLSSVPAPELRSVKGPKLYAQAGLWYDALGALSKLIRSQPQNLSLLKQRASLLQQVGLVEVALIDHGP